MSYHDESTMTIANAVELATRVIARVAGDLVSSNLNGEPATSAVLGQAVAAKIQSALKPEMGAAQ